jgi:hypothetical protein
MMVDGARMRSRKESCCANLTTNQLNMLVEIVTEENGSMLPRQEFTDIVLLMCEDIAGLEQMTRIQSNQLLKKLWSRYQRSNSADQHQ